MDHRVDLASPEVEKAVDARKLRRQVKRLPHEPLQQRRMIRHVVDHLGGGQPPASQLLRKLALSHVTLRIAHSHARWRINARAIRKVPLIPYLSSGDVRLLTIARISVRRPSEPPSK